MELGSSSSSPSSNYSDSPLNGLKFGKKIYFENAGVGAPAKSGGGSSSSGLPPPAPAKKGRNGVVQGGQPPRCQVEGCQADLSDAKAYYSRHKVCGTHSKSPKVIVAGLEQRFCQQCSRFHLLPEFDQGKRSCRRRLAGHNERRRKPPPGSLLSSRYGSLASSIFDTNSRAGGFIMDFTTSPRLGGRDPWPITKASGRVSSTAPGKFIPNPWQNNSENPPPDLFLQGSASQTNYVGPGIPSGECFTGVSGSGCALSLLSNHPWSSRDRALSLGVNSLVNVNGTPVVQAATTPDASINHFSSTSWCFKDSEASGSSHETPPDIGLGQISQPANCQYPSELELAQRSGRQYMELEQSRTYDSPSQHMHWSL